MRASEAPAAGGHRPVLLEAVCDLIVPALEGAEGAVVVDGTVGLGGHAEALLRAAPACRLIGIDRDPTALQAAGGRLAAFGSRVRLVHANAADWRTVVEEVGWGRPRALLLDLGVSSPQLDRPERGFAFRQDGPLDMRMDPTAGPTAADLLMRLDARQLERVLREYGEERHARRIARHLAEVERRAPIRTTRALAEAVVAALPPAVRGRGRDHPARRTFQALRIAVNDELASLERALEEGVDMLTSGGRIAVIAFHSLEDRIVKRALRAGQAAGRLAVLTPRPLTASAGERRDNPRARSAKLRAAERLGAGPARLTAAGRE